MAMPLAGHNKHRKELGRLVLVQCLQMTEKHNKHTLKNPNKPLILALNGQITLKHLPLFISL